MLQQDCRLSNAQLAERVGLSPSACWRRVRTLEEDGVIAGYAAAVDPDRAGLEFHAIVHVRLARHDREAVQREMAARGEMPTALHNNCSGKHAGFVCLACHTSRRAGGRALSDPVQGYVQAGHPVMREVTRAL